MNCLIQKTPSGWQIVYNGCGEGNCQIPNEQESEQYQLWQSTFVPCKG